MIHANPLKRKGLRRSERSRNANGTHPSPRLTANTSPTISRVEAKEETQPIQKIFGYGDFTSRTITKQNIIQRIVESFTGLTYSEVHYVLDEYCKAKRYEQNDSVGSGTASILRQLVAKQLITRIKVNDVWRYYKRYD